MKRVILGLTQEISVMGSLGKEYTVIARIDTGATASSIDAVLAEKWGLGPVMKTKIIKSASGVRSRPVVKVKIKLHSLLLEEYFNLADRAHMTYQVLLGQNILKKGNFLIDPRRV